jgi:hypothetical protein
MTRGRFKTNHHKKHHRRRKHHRRLTRRRTRRGSRHGSRAWVVQRNQRRAKKLETYLNIIANVDRIGRALHPENRARFMELARQRIHGLL